LIATSRRRRVLFLCLLALLGVPVGVLWYAFHMPGASDCERLGASEAEVAEQLAKHVGYLAGTLGARSTETPDALEASARYVEQQLERAGWRTVRQPVEDGAGSFNVVAEREPQAALPPLVIGAHYDTVAGSPGADDNASGVAVLLEIGRLLPPSDARQVRLIAFTNEEDPLRGTRPKGSFFAAAESRARGEALIGMIALESLGFFSDEPGSQRYPSRAQLLSAVGDYWVMLGDLDSRSLLHRTISAFRATSTVAAEGAVVWPRLSKDTRRSDHASYWDHGYPALLITDTAEFRNPNYHRASDLPDTLDYRRMANATIGIASAVRCLVR
jgi:hypothetical protein